jgi:transcriptional regulator with XRE-family HTH domain
MDNETKEVIARAELPIVFRTIRQSLGLSQEKMAELSGISRVQISYYETGDSTPTMATFRKWLLGVHTEIQRIRKNKWGANAEKKPTSWTKPHMDVNQTRDKSCPESPMSQK